jgi:predicted Zn-ribbon and HTH transcriptional regulator
MQKAKYLNDLMTQYESEEIISKKINEISFEQIGSAEFIEHHANLSKLNMQEMKNILTGGEDVIMTQFIDHDKLKLLIKELYTINTFKEKVYPTIKDKIISLSSIKTYFILYHEAVIVNLLESFLYSITACQASEDYLVDVIEYCYKMISKYISYKMKNPDDTLNYGNNSPLFSDAKDEELSLEEKIKKINEQVKDKKNDIKEMEDKYKEIEFQIAMSSINILRYISDHLEQLPFPVRHHMMNVKDVPVLFVTLMELRPWRRKVMKYNETSKKKEEIEEIYENNNWTSLMEHKYPKLEAQILITIYNLVMNQDNNKKYEITEYRQNQLLRLRKYFTEDLYDQIPQMMNLYRSLENMSLMTYGNTLTVNPFIVEMVPILSGNKIFKLTEEQIKQIGNYVVKNHFENLTREKLAKELEPVNEIYNLDNIEYFMEDPVCAQCGKLANSRCSRCKSEWYCSKECQIKRWKEHKTVCKTLAALFKENENDLSKKKVEFNHIKVSGDQISQEVSSGELDINKVKEENDKKMKKIFVEEIKEKKGEEINNNKSNDKKEKENGNGNSKEIKTKEKDKGNELDDLD